MIYLASPFTDPNPAIREERYRAACRQAAEMLRCGLITFSPIAHSYGIAAHGLPGDWAFWEKYDRAFLEMCDEVWVLMLDGWETSTGVQAEIAMAMALGKRVVFVEPDGRIQDSIKDQTPAVAGAVGAEGMSDATL